MSKQTKVYALVGASGTGKSYRAILLSKELGLEWLIDDGLLIHKDKIVAGVSAKSQNTRLGAVKTALFSHEAHRNPVLNTLRSNDIEGILILGTSQGMITKITEALDLPYPCQWFKIEERATPEEISTALAHRRTLGHHVIPAPMAEVEKNLPNKLMSSLQVYFSPQKSSKQANRELLWADQTIIRPNFTGYGGVYISEEVIESLVKYYVKTSFPQLKITQVKITFIPQGLILKLHYSILYKTTIPSLIPDVEESLFDFLHDITGIHVEAQHHHIDKIHFGN